VPQLETGNKIRKHTYLRYRSVGDGSWQSLSIVSYFLFLWYNFV